MGTPSILRGIVDGIAGAAGDTNTQQNLQKINDQVKQNQENHKKAQIAPLALSVKNLQSGIQNAYSDYRKANPDSEVSFDQWKSGPGAQQFGQFVDSTQHAVHSMREILHPDWTPGPTEWMKTHLTDRIHITNAAGREAERANDASWDAYNERQIAQSQAGAANGKEVEAARQKQSDALAQVKARAENVKATADSRKRDDFAAFQQAHPEYKGTFEQWSTEQAGAGRNVAAAAKPPNRDDKYIAIAQKQAAGEELTPEDRSYKAGYEMLIQKKIVAPAIARAAAFSANRYVPVVDPSDPEKVTLMRAVDAAHAQLGTPQSIAFQSDRALTRAFTSGNEAKTITAFNTASDHLQQLGEAAKALDNGDIQAFNRISVAYQKATGNPAPTNFEAIRAAAAGEIAKTFGELNIPGVEAVTAPMSTAGSPAQLAGAIGANYSLMQSKLHGLQGQYEAGKSGKPNFPAGPKTQQLQRKVGEVKKFPNGKTGVWDGQGWVAQQ